MATVFAGATMGNHGMGFSVEGASCGMGLGESGDTSVDVDPTRVAFTSTG